MATSWISLAWSFELFDMNVIYKADHLIVSSFLGFLNPFLLDSLNLLIFKG